jgi:uncharacterized protein (UPF0210 family)
LLKQEKLKYKKESKDDPDYLNILKDYKKRSRHIQRKNIKLMETHNYINLDQLRREKDKDRFWRKINPMKMNVRVKLIFQIWIY